MSNNSKTLPKSVMLLKKKWFCDLSLSLWLCLVVTVHVAAPFSFYSRTRRCESTPTSSSLIRRRPQDGTSQCIPSMHTSTTSVFLLPRKLSQQQSSCLPNRLEFGVSFRRRVQIQLQAESKRTTTAAAATTSKSASTKKKVKKVTRKGKLKTQAKKKKNTKDSPKRAYRKELWNTMLPRLEAFVEEHGHARVTPDHGDTELYMWTRHLRRQYRHQAVHYQQYLQHDVTTTNDDDDDDNKNKKQQPNGTTTTATIPPVRTPRLSQGRFQQLQGLQFCWDYKSTMWDAQYQELLKFYEKYGHTRVSVQHFPRLGVFCQNQRRDYRKLQEQQLDPSSSSSSTDRDGGSNHTINPSSATTTNNLTPERLEALNKIEFFAPASYRPHELSWQEQYENLVNFSKIHGHANVPEWYEKNYRLGHWCMNQRTHYRFYENPNYATGMTKERIDKLSELGFEFQYREEKWRRKFRRLQEYHETNGHIDIPTSDTSNNNLRLWLNVQRYWYNLREKKIQQLQQPQEEGGQPQQQQQQQPQEVDNDLSVASPLTQERIDMLESIPNFSWRKRRSMNGPSKEDWSKLFVAIREKGIVPGTRAKQHMFDGVNPLERTEEQKHVWTEEELLALWHAEDDEDEDEDDPMFLSNAELDNTMVPEIPPR